ncbi:MAG TPA: Pr6Pr family membrane protein [Terriglobales bacterium]|nr:Pr6Pr family membrane protein [Terriglobales bacterium]
MPTTSPSTSARRAAAAIAVLAWYGLLLQFYVMIVNARAIGVPMATAIANYFSFFTILTNLLVAVSLTLSLRRTPSTLGILANRPTVQTAATLYIAIVGIVYSLALRHIWDPEGLQKIADIILHDTIPALSILFWLLFVRKDELRFRDIPAWLVYPSVYLVYSMIRGAVLGGYVYPFLDAGALGCGPVIINVVAIAAAFAGLGLLLVGFGRWRSKSPFR